MKRNIFLRVKAKTKQICSAYIVLFFSFTTIPFFSSAQSDTVYTDIPDMPEADINAVMGWIKSRVEIVRTPYCYRDSYGRGAGVVRSVCATDLEKNGSLCYPKCNSGYNGAGPVCWQVCPSGYRDDGAYCAKPAAYGRGTGRAPDKGPCPEGQRDDGTSCWEDLKVKTEDKGHYNYSWGCGTNVIPCYDGTKVCKNDCYRTWIVKLVTTSTGCGCIKKTLFDRQSCRENEDRNGAFCYPKCNSGFHAEGCCICSPDCPPGFGADIGVSCTKKSYGRGAGEILQCPSGYVPDETGGPAGLCYRACKSGYHGVGPVCWQTCTNGLVPCGAGCAASQTECGTTTFEQVFSVAILAANIATLGGAKAGATAAKVGEEVVSVGSKVRIVKNGSLAKYLWKAVDLLQSVSKSSTIKNITILKRYFNPKTLAYIQKAATAAAPVALLAKNTYDATTLFMAMYNNKFEEQTSKEINETINNQFNPRVAEYIKKTWAEIQLTQMATADGFAIAKDVLDVVSIADITGIVGVISAYTHPICGTNVPFPTLLQNYK